jgi:ubiquinone/menaquinone biosynthesis C-methylase UbiE
MIDLSTRIKRYTETGVPLIQEVKRINPDVVLDLGCGENLYKPFFKQVVGVDSDPTSSCDIVANIENLSFDDNYADVTFCFGVLSSSQVSLALPEIKRVTKAEGLIFIRDLLDIEDSLEAVRVANNMLFDRPPTRITKVTDSEQIRLFWVLKNSK